MTTDLHESVKERLEDQHPGFALVLSTIAGGVAYAAFGSLLAPAGIALLAIPAIALYRKRNLQQWEEFDKGNIAPLLNAHERRQYERENGKLAYQKALGVELPAPIGEPQQAIAQPATEAKPVVAATVAIVPSEPVVEAEPMVEDEGAIDPPPVMPSLDVSALGLDESPSINPLFIPSASPDRFDWARLQNGDAHPVIAIVSPMGGGKSRIVKYLGRHILFSGESFDGLVYDVCGRPEEWKGYRIAYDESDMIKAMYQDCVEIADRLKAYRAGQNEFSPMLRVLEEAVDTLPALKALGTKFAEVVDSWQRQFGSKTRKLKVRAIYISTELVASAIGMTASGRDSCTLIFPGDAGVALALGDSRILGLGSRENQGIRENLKRSLSTCQRPALVFHYGKWYYAEIPELDSAGNPKGHPDFNKSIAPTPTREQTIFDRLSAEATAKGLKEFASFVDWLGKKSGQEITLGKIASLWGNKQTPAMAAIGKLEPLVKAAIAHNLLTETTPPDHDGGASKRTFEVAKC